MPGSKKDEMQKRLVNDKEILEQYLEAKLGCFLDIDQVKCVEQILGENIESIAVYVNSTKPYSHSGVSYLEDLFKDTEIDLCKITIPYNEYQRSMISLSLSESDLPTIADWLRVESGVSHTPIISVEEGTSNVSIEFPPLDEVPQNDQISQRKSIFKSMFEFINRECEILQENATTHVTHAGGKGGGKGKTHMRQVGRTKGIIYMDASDFAQLVIKMNESQLTDSGLDDEEERELSRGEIREEARKNTRNKERQDLDKKEMMDNGGADEVGLTFSSNPSSQDPFFNEMMIEGGRNQGHRTRSSNAHARLPARQSHVDAELRQMMEEGRFGSHSSISTYPSSEMIVDEMSSSGFDEHEEKVSITFNDVNESSLDDLGKLETLFSGRHVDFDSNRQRILLRRDDFSQFIDQISRFQDHQKRSSREHQYEADAQLLVEWSKTLGNPHYHLESKPTISLLSSSREEMMMGGDGRDQGDWTPSSNPEAKLAARCERVDAELRQRMEESRLGSHSSTQTQASSEMISGSHHQPHLTLKDVATMLDEDIKSLQSTLGLPEGTLKIVQGIKQLPITNISTISYQFEKPIFMRKYGDTLVDIEDIKFISIRVCGDNIPANLSSLLGFFNSKGHSEIVDKNTIQLPYNVYRAAMQTISSPREEMMNGGGRDHGYWTPSSVPSSDDQSFEKTFYGENEEDEYEEENTQPLQSSRNVPFSSSITPSSQMSMAERTESYSNEHTEYYDDEDEDEKKPDLILYRPADKRKWQIRMSQSVFFDLLERAGISRSFNRNGKLDFDELSDGALDFDRISKDLKHKSRLQGHPWIEIDDQGQFFIYFNTNHEDNHRTICDYLVGVLELTCTSTAKLPGSYTSQENPGFILHTPESKSEWQIWMTESVFIKLLETAGIPWENCELNHIADDLKAKSGLRGHPWIKEANGQYIIYFKTTHKKNYGAMCKYLVDDLGLNCMDRDAFFELMSGIQNSSSSSSSLLSQGQSVTKAFKTMEDVAVDVVSGFSNDFELYKKIIKDPNFKLEHNDEIKLRNNKAAFLVVCKKYIDSTVGNAESHDTWHLVDQLQRSLHTLIQNNTPASKVLLERRNTMGIGSFLTDLVSDSTQTQLVVMHGKLQSTLQRQLTNGGNSTPSSSFASHGFFRGSEPSSAYVEELDDEEEDHGDKYGSGSNSHTK